MKLKVYIRADGGAQIGLGHIVRCSALAHMLKEHFEINFFCREIPDAIREELNTSGFPCNKIENEDEFLDKLTYKTIVVLDGYHFDTDYQKQIKASGAKLVCIDDIHNKEFVADVIINHTPGIRPKDYKAKPYTQFALGLDYALVRPAFLEQAKKPRTIKKIETVMICFGGSDTKNLTEYAVNVTSEFSQFRKIIVVTGSAYQLSDSFNLLLNNKKIEHRQSLNEHKMLDAMLEAELAIVPASGVLLEVLAAGCIPLIGYYVDNQKLFHDFLHQNFGINSYTVDMVNLNLKSNLIDILNHKPNSQCELTLRNAISNSKNNIIEQIKKLQL